jgi:glutathione S-transferase
MKLFHAPRTRSSRVVWMIEEMGLPCEVVNAGFPPNDPEFAAGNPTGTLPLLIDGEVKLTESIAILQYLAGRYGPTPLAVGPDEAGFADYLQFLEVGEASLATPLTSLVRTRFLAPADQKANWTVENCQAVYLDRLKLVAAQLARGPYMAAGRFTAADISVGYALGFGEGLKLAEGFPPGLIDYWRGLQARPAYQRAQAR